MHTPPLHAHAPSPVHPPLRCVEINPAAEAPFLKSRSRLLEQQQRAGPITPQRAGPTTPTAAPALALPPSAAPPPAGSPPSIQYLVAAAGSAPRAFLEGPDVVVVDPPRKGLEEGLLKALLTDYTAVRKSLGGIDCLK